MFESGKILLGKRPVARGRLCLAKNPVTLTSAVLTCFLTSEPFAMNDDQTLVLFQYGDI